MLLSIKRHNKNAVELTVGSRTWYFSYQTCVAFENLSNAGDTGERRVRRQSSYSVTTAKHMTYMGVRDWPQVDDQTFERIAGA